MHVMGLVLDLSKFGLCLKVGRLMGGTKNLESLKLDLFPIPKVSGTKTSFTHFVFNIV